MAPITDSAGLKVRPAKYPKLKPLRIKSEAIAAINDEPIHDQVPVHAYEELFNNVAAVEDVSPIEIEDMDGETSTIASEDFSPTDEDMVEISAALENCVYADVPDSDKYVASLRLLPLQVVLRLWSQNQSAPPHQCSY